MNISCFNFFCSLLRFVVVVGGEERAGEEQSFLIVELGGVNIQVVLCSPNLNLYPWNPGPSQEVSIEFKARLKYT